MNAGKRIRTPPLLASADNEKSFDPAQNRSLYSETVSRRETRVRRPVPHHHRVAILTVLNEREGPVRWQELREMGIDHHSILEMVREGTVLSPVNGVFAARRHYEALPFALSVLSAHGTDFFLCLTSAAFYHGLLAAPDEYLWAVLPSNRNTLRDICGFEPVPVRWSAIRLLEEAIDLSSSDRNYAGWLTDMTEAEATERFFGVYRECIYGNPVRITSPARTICDLLMFRNRPILREGLNGLAIDDEVAFDALKVYCENFEVEEALIMSERLGYGRDVADFLSVAGRFTPAIAR